MRLLLDAHYSGRWVGIPLRPDGHDVRAADAEEGLVGKSDASLIEIATAEIRILITGDTEDFSKILHALGDAGQSHAGVILVPSSIRNNDFGTLIRGVRAALVDTTQEEWTNRAVWLSHH